MSDAIHRTVYYGGHSDEARDVLERIPNLEVFYRSATSLRGVLEGIRETRPEFAVLDGDLLNGPDDLSTLQDLERLVDFVVWHRGGRRETVRELLTGLSARALDLGRSTPSGIRDLVDCLVGDLERELDQRLLQRGLQKIRHGFVVTDLRLDDNPIVYCNDHFLRLTGYNEHEVLGRNCRFLQGRGTDEETVDCLRDAVRNAEPVRVEILNERKDGTEFWQELSISPVWTDWDVDGPSHYIGVQQDITDRVEAERRLREQNRELQLYRRIVENTTDAVRVRDDEGKLELVNESFENVFGVSEESSVGRRLTHLIDDESIRRVREDELAEEPTEGEVVEEQIRTERDDETRILSTTRVPVEDDQGEEYLVEVSRDVTERRNAQRELEEQTLHDELTGLPNRRGLRQQLDEWTENGEAFGLGFVDVDDFKAINDRHGHAAGDQVLVEVGARLEAVLRPRDVAARAGGDEFVLLLHGMTVRDEFHQFGERLRTLVEPAFETSDSTVDVSLSIGFASFDARSVDASSDRPDADALRRAADDAMYRAKRRSGTTWAFVESPESHAVE